MKIICLFIVLILAGCTGRGMLVWEHPQGLDNQQLLQAQKECQQIAHRETRFPHYIYGTYGSPLFPFYRPFYYHDRHYADDVIWHDHVEHMSYQREFNRLYRICMTAKGWSLVYIPAEEPDGHTGTNQ